MHPSSSTSEATTRSADTAINPRSTPLKPHHISTMKFTTALFAFVAPVFALQEASIPKQDVNLEFSALKAPQVADTLELLLEAINSIPDDVLLAGDEATNVST